MTKYKTTKTTVTVLEKLGAGAETIEAFEAGALVKIGQAAKGADDIINPLIQTMYTNGVRAKDWMAKAGLPAGSKIPATRRENVDLPEPIFPTSATFWPAGTLKDKFLRVG